MFGGAEALCVLAECGREDGVADSHGHEVVADEFASELVVVAVGEDELHFITLGESLQILRAEGSAFAGGRTFYVDDFVDFRRDVFKGTLAAGFDQNRVPKCEQPLHERNDFALVQHRFATCELDQASVGGHRASTLEGVLAVAPGAAKVANRGADKDARESCEGGFTLERFVEFDDLHGSLKSTVSSRKSGTNHNLRLPAYDS